MKVRTEILQQKLLIGKTLKMSLGENKTRQLWHSFMIEKNLIPNSLGTDLYSIQVYIKPDYFKKNNPQTEFAKWATIEVNTHDNIPNGFNKFILEPGLFAVFIHKGLASDFSKTAQYIFGEWLPKSEFELDDRPHFEVLGKRCKNDDSSSEEEVWIPIKNKP